MRVITEELKIVLEKIFPRRLGEECFFPYLAFEQLLKHFPSIFSIHHRYPQRYFH